MYQKYGKRALDFILSLGGIVCLSWLLLALAAAIKLDSPGPVFFKQKRVGIHKTHFEIYKFRTMRSDTPHDMPTHLLTDPDRYITRVGRFLRRTSLDELPQLWNILKGDMAVIGPRPALWNQYDLLEERDKYDEKKLCRATGLVCLLCGVLMCVLAWLGYRVETGAMAEQQMLPYALVSSALILLAVLAAVIYSNTKAKK